MEIETPKQKMVRAICSYLCIYAGIEPMDSMDGSSNWWMFHNDVQKLISNLEERGFSFPPK